MKKINLIILTLCFIFGCAIPNYRTEGKTIFADDSVSISTISNENINTRIYNITDDSIFGKNIRIAKNDIQKIKVISSSVKNFTTTFWTVSILGIMIWMVFTLYPIFNALSD